MPYSISNPPAKIDGLPKHTKEIWIAAFNAALKEYDDEGKANVTAWSAVTSAGYEKDAAGEWRKGAKRMDIKDLWDKLQSIFEPLLAVPEMERATEFLPTQTRALTITRAADGKARWLMIAASAVINRVRAIDSTVLFDNFIKRAQESGVYPKLDFFHEEERLTLGVADWLRREGALYLASGTFDDTPLAQAAAAGLDKERDYWGASIAFQPTVAPLALVSEGEIPVYTDGINRFISVVPKSMAAHLFTATSSAEEVKRMNKTAFDELVKLVGLEAAQPFAALVDDTNRTITETGMVTRSDTDAPTTQTPLAELPPAVDVPPPTEAAPVVETPPEEQRQDLAAVKEMIKTLADRVAALEASIAGQAVVEESKEKRSVDRWAGIDARVQAVEGNSKAWAAWIAGLPEKTRNETTYRARQEESGPIDSGNVATATLSQMKHDLPRKR
jgi:cation transport regulator ChaB